MDLFRRFRRARYELPPVFDPRRPLCWFGPHDPWTIGDSFEGTQIFGATGSGKTSGSGRTIAKAMLAEGFGGLVLTAKRDELDLWRRYCAEVGRSDSLLVFGVDEPCRFNFMDYELRRGGAGGGLTENIANLFTAVLDGGGKAGGGVSRDPYWDFALKQMLRNAVDLLRLSGQSVSLPNLARVIASAPKSPEDVTDPVWQRNSYCFECFTIADRPGLAPMQLGDLEVTAAFWLAEFPAIAENTRSNIVSTFTTMADGFMRGHLRELFCGATNVVPELTHNGVVLVINLPLKEFHDLGRYAQLLWKYLWQRATESRDVAKNPRPVFVWADESQLFATARDREFQSTARSQRASTVYLTQNISSYYAAIGGPDAKASADSLLGNLQTKIFHANGDAETNEWAERIIGKSWGWRSGTSSSSKSDGDKDGGGSSSSSRNESLDAEVLAREFTTLRKGGPANGGLVEGIVFQGGRVWNSNGKTHVRVRFDQNG